MNDNQSDNRQLSDDSEDMAENRTALAEDRTIMANERTFSSWTGTGLGCVGIGLAVQAIFKEAEPTWIAKLAATVFMLAAIAFFFFAWRNACRTLSRLDSHEATPASRQHLTRISSILGVGTLITTVILWTL